MLCLCAVSEFVYIYFVFAQCAKTFLNLMAHISKEQTVQYILTLIDDTLQVRQQTHWLWTNRTCMSIYRDILRRQQDHSLKTFSEDHVILLPTSKSFDSGFLCIQSLGQCHDFEWGNWCNCQLNIEVLLCAWTLGTTQGGFSNYSYWKQDIHAYK